MYMAKLTQEEFIRRCTVKHNGKYTYDKVVYITTRYKIIVTCPDHGDFVTLADNHLRTSGCPKCGTIAGAKYTTLTYKDFLERIDQNTRDNFIYTESDYKNILKPIGVFCKKHNLKFYQSPREITRGHIGCKSCISEKLSKNTRSCTEEFISMSRQIYNNRFSYDKTIYTVSTAEVVVTCKEHGDFKITPKAFQQGMYCKKCMKLDLYKTKSVAFLENFKASWPGYTVKSVYNGCYKPLVINCDKHGDFHATPEQCRTLVEICDRCRVARGSQQELRITNLLDEHNIAYHTHKKIKTPNSFFEIDIFIPSFNLGIEVNGLYWHRDRENGRYSRDYHLNKTRYCNEQGIRLLHFYDAEIDNKFNIVKAILENKLNLNSRKIYARNTEIKYIDKDIKKGFLKDYHMQGNDRSSIHIGLYVGDELLSVMTFGNRQITRSVDHELMRYCVKSGVNVVGGFSKMLKFYTRNHKVHNIKTYADKRYSDGNVYRLNGFKHLRDSTPSYWYFTSREYILYHRYNFAKHLLKNKLENFDINKTEAENMSANNYFRIWDCGQCVFEYTISY